MRVIAKKIFAKDIQKVDLRIVSMIKSFILFAEVHTWENILKQYDVKSMK